MWRCEMVMLYLEYIYFFSEMLYLTDKQHNTTIIGEINVYTTVTFIPLQGVFKSSFNSSSSYNTNNIL